MHFLCRNYAFFYLDSNITIKGPIGVSICILSRKMSEVSVFGFRYENTTLQKFAVENTTPQSVFVSKYDFTIVLYNKIQYHNGEM